MKNSIKLLLLTLMIFVSSGCSRPSLTVELISKEVEALSFESTCSLLKSINGFEIELIDTNINTAIANDEMVTCSKIDNSKLGEALVEFKGKSASTTALVQIVDSTPPTLSFEDNVVVEEGNNYFNLENLIVVKDSIDSNPSVEFDGSYDLSKVGEYKVKVIANDASNNKTRKNVTINVIEKEKEIVTVIEERPSTPSKPNAGGGNTSNAGGNTGGNNGGTTPPSKPNVSKPTNKYFMYVDGYDMNSAYSACVTYILDANKKGFGGSCLSIDENGISKGYKATIN